MKCMCAQTRSRFILSSERVLGGMELEPMLTPREKSPLPENFPRGESNPASPNTTNELFRPPFILSKGNKQILDMGSPGAGEVTKYKTDYFLLSSDRKIVGNCEVIAKVDIRSDHSMVRARVEINKKLTRLIRITQVVP